MRIARGYSKIKEASYSYKVKTLDDFMDALAEIINDKDPKAFEVGYFRIYSKSNPLVMSFIVDGNKDLNFSNDMEYDHITAIELRCPEANGMKMVIQDKEIESISIDAFAISFKLKGIKDPLMFID